MKYLLPILIVYYTDTPCMTLSVYGGKTDKFNSAILRYLHPPLETVGKKEELEQYENINYRKGIDSGNTSLIDDRRNKIPIYIIKVDKNNKYEKESNRNTDVINLKDDNIDVDDEIDIILPKQGEYKQINVNNIIKLPVRRSSKGMGKNVFKTFNNYLNKKLFQKVTKSGHRTKYSNSPHPRSGQKNKDRENNFYSRRQSAYGTLPHINRYALNTEEVDITRDIPIYIMNLGDNNKILQKRSIQNNLDKINSLHLFAHENPEPYEKTPLKEQIKEILNYVRNNYDTRNEKRERNNKVYDNALRSLLVDKIVNGYNRYEHPRPFKLINPNHYSDSYLRRIYYHPKKNDSNNIKTHYFRDNKVQDLNLYVLKPVAKTMFFDDITEGENNSEEYDRQKVIRPIGRNTEEFQPRYQSKYERKYRKKVLDMFNNRLNDRLMQRMPNRRQYDFHELVN